MSAPAKQSFSSIYDDPHPHGYFETLDALGYRRPDFVLEWARSRADALGPDATVVDIGCSYGVNSVALKHDRSFTEAAALVADAPADAAAGAFTSLAGDRPAPRVVGIDVSAHATGWAVDAGLLDAAVVRDLNTEDLTAAEVDLIASPSVVLASGIFSYLHAPGFARIFAATGDLAGAEFVGWPLYGEDVSGVVDQLEDLGRTTVHDQVVLHPQRSYATPVERDHFRAQAESRGLPWEGTAAEQALCVTQLTAR